MTVQFFGSVQEYTGGEKSVEVEGVATVRALIELLNERMGASFGEFLAGDDTCLFLVNGKGILATGGLNTPLCADDSVEILPFVEGG